MMNTIKASAEYIKGRVNFEPEVGIILGTGLGGLVEHIEVVEAIPYAEIPNFPVSTVEGHSGKLIFGTLGGKKVVAMQGRFHYYEGYTAQQVVFPVRVLKLLGIKYLFVSNAAGSMNSTFRVGDVMVINDHINLIPNPLIGKNIAELGPRFPDMNDAYNPELIAKATAIAEREGIKLQYGCYVALTGPTFETPKEYMWVKIIGGDAVGISTAPEVIAARHMNIPVFGVSIITDTMENTSVSHEEVQANGRLAEKNMTKLFTELLKTL
ncbi:MAG: purine-nucleoside phosphorylase [Tidjanibacter sp.]|nr:purine-nucleoside phosphorylase [Tidjanibacter sp.]